MDVRKPAVPKLDEKPIMGLKSDKNFVHANAVDVILMQSKKRIKESENFLSKKDFGKLPNYILKKKQQVQDEYNRLREIEQQNEADEAALKKKLSDDELNALREGLKKKLLMLKQSYGKITHKTIFDTIVSKNL